MKKRDDSVILKDCNTKQCVRVLDISEQWVHGVQLYKKEDYNEVL